MLPPRPILTINLGSSTAKLAAFDAGLKRLASDSIRLEHGAVANGAVGSDVVAAAETLRESLGFDRWAVVAHRIVERAALPGRVCRCNVETLARLRAAAHRAPLHASAALAVIDALAASECPPETQLAVFDSGFFDSLPEVARRYALPRQIVEAFDLWRVGYHGLAHEAMWRRARELLGVTGSSRLVTLQLGAGASIAAIRDGRPVDVTMGYSPLEGLVMNTRCGDLDPGALLTLLESGRFDPSSLRALLHEQSGLRGLSGASSELRALLDSDDAQSRLAVDVYCHRARRHLGGCLALLGGVDAVVFGGGVGEHLPQIRARILQGLEFAGIRIDACANEAAHGGEAWIDAGDSVPASHHARLLVVAVDEATEIARASLAYLDREDVPS
jgi:acetate kinase